MAEHAAVVNVSRYRPAAGKRQDLMSAMKRMAERAASAKGCFGAQACESDRDREDLIAVSRWESPQALEAFADTAETAADQEHLKGLVAGPAQRENLRPV
ncbi:MAG TPA: antibiotic biosynthesis monooxygenase family protein [Candidatus Dormibacteraeota bacterium]|jgi:quinol monooxygenase YgiN|nr:antibiotic biosynthesis monooxygenase family protein [Candidatus Dormibacteraeota bacterium]